MRLTFWMRVLSFWTIFWICRLLGCISSRASAICSRFSSSLRWISSRRCLVSLRRLSSSSRRVSFSWSSFSMMSMMRWTFSVTATFVEGLLLFVDLFDHVADADLALLEPLAQGEDLFDRER